MRYRELIERTCQTPGAMFHLTIKKDKLGGVVNLPDAVRLDVDEDQAKAIENDLHDALEAVVVDIVAKYDPDAKDHWRQASAEDTHD